MTDHEETNEGTQAVQDFLKEVLGERGERLDVIKNVQHIQHLLFQREARRLGEKLPEGDRRRANLRARLKLSAEISADIEDQFRAARISPPRVAGKEALFQGRILDERMRGARQVRVSIEDHAGNIAANLGSDETAPAGYYAIKASPAAVKALKTLKEGAFLTVRNSQGEVLYRESERLEIGEGDRHFRNITVGRPIPSSRPRPPAAVRGRVEDEAPASGKASKSATKTKKSGTKTRKARAKKRAPKSKR